MSAVEVAHVPVKAASSPSVPAFQTWSTRVWILLCFYSTILLSLPFWLRTTTIERLPLPGDQVQAWEAQLPCPVRFRHTITLRLPANTVRREQGPELTREIERGLDAASDGIWIDGKESESNTTEKEPTFERPLPLEHAACVDWSVRLSEPSKLEVSSLHYVVTVAEGDATDSFLSTSTTRHFSINAASTLVSRAPSEIAYSLASQLSHLLQLPYRDLFFQAPLPTLGQSSQGAISTQDVLARIDRIEADKRQIPYTRNVRLVFSLINEDASSNGAGHTSDRRSLVGVAGWDAEQAEKAFSRRIGPLITALQGTHRLVTEMQTIWFAPLQFSTQTFSVPRRTPAVSGTSGEEDGEESQTQERAEVLEQDTVHLIKRDDLQVFVNAGEWGLSTGGSSLAENVTVGDVQSELAQMVEQNERTLHFIIYVPKPSHRPLRIASDEQATNVSAATGWLVPQWGGVSLYNLGYENDVAVGSTTGLRHGVMLSSLTAQDLDKAFTAFEKQLRTLLGLRFVAPGGTATLPSADANLAVALDALVRRRILGSMRESVRTLGSIVRLVDKIRILGVGPEVQDDVHQALNMLRQARDLNQGSSPFRQGTPSSLPAPLSPLLSLLEFNFAAELLSSRAFFNPSMLGQLYFPDEHKYAVYTPLFGPLAMPLLVAGLRLLKERRKKQMLEKTAAQKPGEKEVKKVPIKSRKSKSAADKAA